MKKVTVIIPAYNEAEGIGHTLNELLSAIDDNYKVIVVDDGSVDDTYNIVSAIHDNRLRIVQHRYNRGYGSAIRTACRFADGDIIAWYDADGQHRPEDLINVVNLLIAEDFDYVIGVRGADSHVDRNRKRGKKLLNRVANILAREPMPDVNSGLRAFKRDVLIRHCELLPRRFGASTVTSFIMQEMDYLGGYCPIYVRKREGQSTVKPVKDGIATLRLIMNIILLFRSRQILSFVAIILILFGVIYGVAEALMEHLGIPVLSEICIITGTQAYLLGIISAQVSALRLACVDDNDKR